MSLIKILANYGNEKSIVKFKVAKWNFIAKYLGNKHVENECIEPD